MYHLLAETWSVCIRKIMYVHGDRGCGNQIPGGMRKHHPRGCCRNPGICLIHAHGQKWFKGLPRATYCTDRAQTSGSVTPTVELCPPSQTFRVKVRAQRDVPTEKKQMTIVRLHIPCWLRSPVSWTHFFTEKCYYSSGGPSIVPTA